ncbi:MAG: hypothetical protein LBD11_06970 [Candidatus Peribacteria bacterium]|jgi:hypothetical protein|nr:hypothetical protein [Candidatus Peribacteria bacterium]
MKQNEERSNLLLYIDFLLTGSTGSTERKSVPLSVYKEMIVNGDFNQIKGEIPKVVPNPQVDMNDIQRISQIYTVRQERLAKESKEKEEAARIASEQSKIRREKEKKEKAEFNTALKENWEQGTVNLDYTKNNQKFVVSVDPDKKAVVFSSKFLPFHADIHHTYVKNGYCLGGGRMYIDEHKNIRLYSSSESYGSVPEEFQSTVEKILKKQYPEANIKRNYPKIYGEKREPRSEY